MAAAMRVDVIAVCVIAVCVIAVGVFAVGVGMHIKFPARDPLTETALKVRMDGLGHAEGFQGIQEYGLRNSQVPERANRHVAGNAGKAVKIKNSHGNFQ